MKEEVFNQYVNKVLSLFKMSKADIFSKSKKRDVVDARHLLYYICSKRPMRLTYIQKFMENNGYVIHHSSVIHGIACVEKRMQQDRDYISVVKDLENSVSFK
jgi:chromosomal replication initiation ATPase DnaA